MNPKFDINDFESATDKVGYIEGCDKRSIKSKWDYISSSIALTEDFIEKYKDEVEWVLIKSENISEQFIEKHITKLNMELIIENIHLSIDFIEKHKGNLNWEKICIYQALSEEFIEKYQNDVNWRIISTHQKLSEEFIEKYQRELFWDEIIRYQQLSEAFIEKHWMMYATPKWWLRISINQKLSEQFIEKYMRNLEDYFSEICTYQALSEDFIEKYQHLIKWECISRFQYMSIGFIIEHIEKLDIDALHQNEKLNQDEIAMLNLAMIKKMRE